MLIEYCIAHNVLILNGLIHFPTANEFSFHSVCGSSVIDYCLCSVNLLPVISHFTVDTRVESDHLPLLIMLQHNQEVRIAEISQFEHDPDNIMRRIRWSPKLEESLTSLFNSPLMLELRGALMEARLPEVALSIYSKISLQCGTMSKPLATPTAENLSWFNKDCSREKKQLRELYKEYRQSGDINKLKLYLDYKKKLPSVSL